MATNLTQAKEWLRISDDSEDITIDGMRLAAIALLEIEIGSQYEDLTIKYQRLFDVAVKLLVGEWYENRENIAIGSSMSMIEQSVGTQRIINLLKNWSAYKK